MTQQEPGHQEIYEVDIIFKGGARVTFPARMISLSKDLKSYIVTSYPGDSGFTVLDPILKTDISFISLKRQSTITNRTEPDPGSQSVDSSGEENE